MPGPGHCVCRLRLREQIVFLVGDEFALDEFRRFRIIRSIDAVDIGGTAAADLVHDVDRVALGEKVLRPAVAAVGRAVPARSRRAAAVNHHNRIRMLELLRNLVVDVGVTGHHLTVLLIHIFAADEEISLLRDAQWPDALRGLVADRARGDKSRRDHGCDGAQPRCRRSSKCRIAHFLAPSIPPYDLGVSVILGCIIAPSAVKEQGRARALKCCCGDISACQNGDAQSTQICRHCRRLDRAPSGATTATELTFLGDR